MSSTSDSDSESVTHVDKLKEFTLYLMYLQMPTKQDTEDIYKKFFPEKELNDIKDIIALCNKEISGMNCVIQEIICEVTGTVHYIPIPTDNHSGFIHTVQEQEYLRYILSMIVTSQNGYMQSIDLLNSCTNKIYCHNLIQHFIRHKYLMEKAPGEICLTPLAIAIFEPLLKEQFEDQLDTCDLCHKICVFGYKCIGCQSKFHNHCKKHWLQKRSVCPKCDNTWDETLM